MRWLPRSAVPVEPLDAARNGDGALQFGERALPRKAQNVLGAKERSRSGGKDNTPPQTYVPTGSPPRRDEQKSMRPILPPLQVQEALSMEPDPRPRATALKSSPASTEGSRMSPFPPLQPRYNPQQTRSANDIHSAPKGRPHNAPRPNQSPLDPSAVQPHQFYPDSKPSIDSFESKMRTLCDDATQSSFLAQQTPTSTVPEHSFRNGSPMISLHATSSDPTLVRPERTLKSAMKKPRQHSDTKKGVKKLDMSSLFAHQPKTRSPGGYTASPLSENQNDFDFFPEEMVRKRLQRPQPEARFETKRSVGTISNNSDSTVRDKVFERDIYDGAKINVRRPPKGIKNWFDGFDISSDSEEAEQEEEKITWQKQKRDPPPAELPATEAMRTEEAIPSTFSPYTEGVSKSAPLTRQQQQQQQQNRQPQEWQRSQPDVQRHRQQHPQAQQWQESKPDVHRHAEQHRQPQRPVHTRKASVDPVEDNLLAIEHAKNMLKKRAQKKPSAGSERRASPEINRPPAHHTQSHESRLARPGTDRPSAGHTQGHESRLAHSRLASQSVLSLSASESDGDSPPRPTLSPQTSTGNTLSRQTSTGNESAIVHNAASVGMHRPAVPPRKLHTAPAAVQENNLRRSISTSKTSGSIPMRLGSDVPMPPLPADRSTLGSPRLDDPTAATLRKLNGIQDSASQASRSRPTTRSAADEARSTAEETTSSATDGSRMMQVSEEEMILLELMRQKRAAMQKDSFSEGYRLALKQEQDHLIERRQGAHRTALQLLKAREELKRQSQASTVFSEDRENPGAAAMRRKYSALHKEDVDKALKLERFLSLDPHGQVQVVPGADQFPAPPIVVDDEEDEEEAPPVLLQPKTYSPMQKLTQKVRDSPAYSRSTSQQNITSRSTSASRSRSPGEEMDDDYMDNHHDRVRAFLASNSASDAQDLFPTPPNRSRMSMLQHEWQSPRNSILKSPSPVPEEEPILDDLELLRPTRLEPERYRKNAKRTSRDRRHEYRRSCTAESDPLLATAGGLAPPQHSLHDPYPDITPTLDSGPLKLPSAGFTGSPSLSSRPSPVTPEFPHVPSSDKTSVVGVEIAGSDNASYGGETRSETPDTEFSAPRAAPSKTKRPARRAGPPHAINPLAGKRGMDRVTSMSSITSAGEDVLAAWAELGGGNSDFNFRKGGRGGR